MYQIIKFAEYLGGGEIDRSGMVKEYGLTFLGQYSQGIKGVSVDDEPAEARPVNRWSPVHGKHCIWVIVSFNSDEQRWSNGKLKK